MWNIVLSSLVPTVVFHGFDQKCNSPLPSLIVSEITSTSGAYAACIEIGQGRTTSIYTSIKDQTEQACKAINEDLHFQEEFNLVGIDQGGAIARGVIEFCNLNGYVRNLVTLGSPNMGYGPIKVEDCEMGRAMITHIGSYPYDFEHAQSKLSLAGLYRDPKYLDIYYEQSCFLPYLNNELEPRNFLIPYRMSSLNAALFVMFSDDFMLVPKESAWFYELQADGSVKRLEETDLYKEDYIGLRALVEEGKAKFEEWPGYFEEVDRETIQKRLVPFLLQ